jgi:hypothetical protein
MKNLRQLCAALVLTLALSANALCGQVNCPGVTDPPPEAAAIGEMPNIITDAVFSLILALI